MSRRRISIAIVVTVFAAFIACGTTFAIAAPHAVVANKHHKKKKKPTLRISGVPASVTEGGSFTVTASGYSGKFNGLEFFPLVVSACKSTYSAEALQQHTSYTAPKDHNFNTSAHIYLYRYNLGHTPGTYQFCVYLYQQFNPGGTQLHQSVTYQVTP